MLPFALLAAALLLRIIDIFVLRLDERWGEIILSKSLGFALLLFFARGDLAFHARSLGRSLAVALMAFVPIYLMAYGLQFAVLAKAGKQPALVLAAIDPKTGLAGGLLFAAWLLLGNVINSCMEEGLFRGVLLSRFTFPWANLAQAALFALWHLVWPLKDLLSGRSGVLGEAAGLLAATFIAGLVYGVLYLRTGNLWAPWLAHTINNTVLNFIHIRTAAGLDADVGARNVALVAGLLLTLPLLTYLSPPVRVE
ncbi:MAG TPA: CPBP family intramembrane glutamic endopeptidase [Symbiobacteriaceae bacterium]|nr:CPBP family intramembrane glutamic endopeptidase [Symbiobacteriaceae bacterium]